MLSFILASAAAISSFRSVYVESVYDGDTFKVSLPGETDVFGKNISIRIRGINSAERKGPRICEKADAIKAKESLENLLKGQHVDLNRCQRDKFFRIVCDVSVFGKKNSDATAYQLAKGWAVPYNGKHKEEWKCTRGKD